MVIVRLSLLFNMISEVLWFGRGLVLTLEAGCGFEVRRLLLIEPVRGYFKVSWESAFEGSVRGGYLGGGKLSIRIPSKLLIDFLQENILGSKGYQAAVFILRTGLIIKTAQGFGLTALSHARIDLLGRLPRSECPALLFVLDPASGLPLARGQHFAVLNHSDARIEVRLLDVLERQMIHSHLVFRGLYYLVVAVY
jgi:hypothetical protein